MNEFEYLDVKSPDLVNFQLLLFVGILKRSSARQLMERHIIQLYWIKIFNAELGLWVLWCF